MWDKGSIVTVQHTKAGGRLVATKRSTRGGDLWEVNEYDRDGALIGPFGGLPKLTNEQFDQFFEFQI